MTTDKTPETKRQTEARTMDDLRIVLFGRDIPKCKLMKIIENAGQFKKDSKNNPPPVGEYQCQKYSRSINDKNVVIIDAPGVDTGGNNKKKLLEEIKWSVAAADPGPHVFLFVETINKPLSDKLEVLEVFQKTFGEQANDFTMMVFIAASEMNTSDPDSCGSERVKPFRKLTYLFNHRYFIFNIKDDKQQQESQVTKLLKKIAEMRGEASAHFYTPKMVWEAEKALKQEEEKKKQEEEKKKQEEEKQKQEEEKKKQEEEKKKQEEEKQKQEEEKKKQEEEKQKQEEEKKKQEEEKQKQEEEKKKQEEEKQKQEEEKKKQEEEKKKQEEEKQKQEEEKKKQEKKMWSKVRDKLLVIGAQVGTTVGLVLSYYIFKDDPSSALGAVGSVVGVVIVAVLYLVFYHLKFKTYTARKEEFSSPDAGAAGKQQLSSASPYAFVSIRGC